MEKSRSRCWAAALSPPRLWMLNLQGHQAQREGFLTPIRSGQVARAQIHYSLNEIAKLAAGGRDDC